MRYKWVICGMAPALVAACSSKDERRAGDSVRVFMWMFGGQVEERGQGVRGAAGETLEDY